MDEREKILEERRKLFDAEREEYLKNPCPPCTYEKAVKLLKRFDNDYDFEKPLSFYLPAVSCGVMRLNTDTRSHDERLKILFDLVDNSDRDNLARDFLYGIKNRDFRYTTALSIYYFAKNLTPHLHKGNNCDICSFYETENESARGQFYWINNDLANFHKGRFNFYISLDNALLYFEEYLKLPRPTHDKLDLDYFMSIMKYIDTLSPFYTPAKLVKELKANGGMCNYTAEGIKDFIDMMGYLDIFHTQKARGVVHSVFSASQRNALERTEYIHPNSYSAFPVVYWRKGDGIDYETIDKLFSDIYK